jgi:hypothetical protein
MAIDFLQCTIRQLPRYIVFDMGKFGSMAFLKELMKMSEVRRRYLYAAIIPHPI